MIFNLITKLLRQSYLHRGLAIFFVLFIFLDITNPDICVEEFVQASTTIEVSTSDRSSDHAKIDNDCINKDQTPADSHQNAQTNERDCCFCCCSHWVMSKKILIPMFFTIKQPLYKLTSVSLPDSPPQNIFHPPCLC